MTGRAAFLALLPAVAPAAIAALALSVLAAALAPARAGEPLSRYAWEGRPLVIFGPSLDDEQLRAQRELFEMARADLAEREMPLIVAGGESALVDGAPAPFSAEALRNAYGVGPGTFAVVLVGKDTGVKLRSGRIIPPKMVFDLVDDMPMRRSEIGGRNG
ncbi:MAG: DUF4174 domain-containing protein [Pseudomonadota bacterium]